MIEKEGCIMERMIYSMKEIQIDMVKYIAYEEEYD
jgi:hypothetical protein